MHWHVFDNSAAKIECDMTQENHLFPGLSFVKALRLIQNTLKVVAWD